ncbi:MAG: hypothetical protein GXO20_08020 [Thermodesulfobacteria bacterium]|nr:hypothetical protein [Thermodesulfobacteriota bacterium]
MRKLSQRLKKSPRTLLFEALPFLLALVVLAAVVYPRYQAWRLEKELLQQKKEEVVRYQKTIAELKSRLKKISGIPKELANKVFSGPDPYVLVAGLREKIEKASEISIRSFRIVKREEIARGLEKVEVNFIFTTDIKGLAEVLWQLEQEPRAVRIKRLSVFVRRNRQGELLSTTLNLEGLFWLKKT